MLGGAQRPRLPPGESRGRARRRIRPAWAAPRRAGRRPGRTLCSSVAAKDSTPVLGIHRSGRSPSCTPTSSGPAACRRPVRRAHHPAVVAPAVASVRAPVVHAGAAAVALREQVPLARLARRVHRTPEGSGHVAEHAHPPGLRAAGPAGVDRVLVRLVADRLGRDDPTATQHPRAGVDQFGGLAVLRGQAGEQPAASVYRVATAVTAAGCCPWPRPASRPDRSPAA